MSPKTILFLSFFVISVSLSGLSFAEEEEFSTIPCFSQSDVLDEDDQAKEEFKNDMQNITQELECLKPDRIMNPGQISEFCSITDIPDTLDRAVTYYSNQSEKISNGLQILGKKSDCGRFFSLISKDLNSTQQSCHNIDLDDATRWSCLDNLYYLLMGAIEVVQRTYNGATLNDFYNDFLTEQNQGEVINEEVQTEEILNDETELSAQVVGLFDLSV